MQSLILTAFLASAASATITRDFNCTAFVGGTNVWAPNAVSCSNVGTDSTCNTLFGDAPPTIQAALVPGNDMDRATKCTASEDLKQMAVNTCPKLCGFCCITPQYKCSNKPPTTARINCATVPESWCRSVDTRQIVAEDCPNVCGFCLEGGCIDVAPDCDKNPTVCVTKGLETFVAEKCKRTCGLCSSTPNPNPGTPTSCVDTNTNCANFVKNGFCSSTFYTTAQKRDTCAKSCGLCASSGK